MMPRRWTRASRLRAEACMTRVAKWYSAGRWGAADDGSGEHRQGREQECQMRRSRCGSEVTKVMRTPRRFHDLRHCRPVPWASSLSPHGSHRHNHLHSRSDMRFRTHRHPLETCRTRGPSIMSATIIPFRPRPSVTALKPTLYFPALIDGHVTPEALVEGLASVGLQLLHDPATGTLLITPQQEIPNDR